MTDQNNRTVDITPSPQKVAHYRATFEAGIKDWRAKLAAWDLLCKRVQSLPAKLHTRAYTEVQNELNDWVEETKERIHASILYLEWGVKEIDFAAEIHNGPHYRVGYAFPHHEFEFYLVPERAIKHFGGLIEAFFALIKLDETEYDIDNSDTTRYTHDGEIWEEPEPKKEK
jgi:hypothetical protein